MPIICVIIYFRRIIIDIIVYGRKRKTCIIFERKKITSLLNRRKIKYVLVARTYPLVKEIERRMFKHLCSYHSPRIAIIAVIIN